VLPALKTTGQSLSLAANSLILMSIDSASWLTQKRLRAHATILAVGLWSIYVWNLATPGLRDRNGNLKGTDFLHLYTLGSVAIAHRGADLYDMNAQAALAARRVPAAAGLRYLPLYPPPVSIVFAPLAYLSYGWALAVWWTFSATVYAASCCGVWRVSPHLRDYGLTVLLAAVAYPAFFDLIVWGQTSALALACFTAMFYLLRAGREFLAGLALGCLIYKPQIGLAAAVVFVLVGAWRVVAGALLSGSAQVAAGVLYYGVSPLRQWIKTLAHARALLPWLEPRPYQTHSLRTFWSMLVLWPDLAFGLYVLSALVVLGLTIAIWKHAAPLAVRYASLLLATVLVAPHLTVYDLVILAPALLLLADWIAGRESGSPPRWFGALLYTVYALPLLGPLAHWTHVQLSVIAMSATVYLIYRTVHPGREGSKTEDRIAS
jgi:hypothetical protein